MNYRKYVSMFLGAALIFAGCEKEEELGSQNKGKARPSVTVTAGEVAPFEYTFTVSASENASQYAIAIFNGKDNAAPVAYDIVVDEVSGADGSYAFNVSDNASVTLTLEGDPDSDYQIFAAAITSTGLLSEVTSTTIHTAKVVEPVMGVYSVSYAALTGKVVNPATGTDFEMDLIVMGDGLVVIQANWFNYAPEGYVCQPYLLGEVDYKNQQIIFDGTYVVVSGGNVSLGQGNAFGGGFYYFDQAKTMMLAFWGGGDSGKEPVVINYDDKGVCKDISYCDYTIHDASTGAGLAVFDALTEGKLTLVMAENAGTKSGEFAPLVLPALSEPVMGLTK